MGHQDQMNVFAMWQLWKIHAGSVVCQCPIEFDKSEVPTTTLTFLSIELDTVALDLRLPLSKFEQLKSIWRGHKACTKRELHSLIGLLSHACKVVQAGRTFLHCLIDFSMVTKHLDHQFMP